jgi:anaerobic magnesium-protoporphyrin IX monomethyl ester cyclase
MKLTLLNPPFHPRFSRSQRSPGVTKSGTFYYPMWLAYAAGVLEQQGQEVQLLDAPASQLNRDTCYSLLAAGKPEVIVLDTSTPSIQNDLEIAAELKRRTGAQIVLVGTHVSVLDQAVMREQPAVDFIARQEYEYTLLELCETLQRGGDRAAVSGLTWRREGEVIRNADRPFCQELDRIPFVSRVYQRHLPYRRYRYSITRHPVITLLTGRGCPFRCRFCLYPQTFSGHGYRRRSVENVVEEFKFIRRAFPDLRDIFIEDDTFTVDHQRIHEFCDAVLREKLKMTWTANARADLDQALLKKMKAAGLRLLCVGFETFSPAVIQAIDKRLHLEQMQQFVRNASQAGVMIHGCFIFGNPGDTRDTFEQTMQYAKSLPLSSAQFFPVMPYPGTKLYDQLKTDGCLTTENYSQWVDARGFHNCVVSYPHLSNREILDACNRAKLSYHFRFRYLLFKILESIRTPGELRRNLQSMWTLMLNGLKGKRSSLGRRVPPR